MSIERGQSRRSRAVRGVLRTWQRTGVALAWCGIASFTLLGVSGCGGPSQTPDPGASTQETLTEAEMVAKLEDRLPKDVSIQPGLYQQKAFIDLAIENVMTALRDGGVLVVIILLLFLMNLRTTLITLTAIPLSIFITALVFAAFGLSVNTMTLGGLAVAIGELVDDAIVDVENIYRRLRENRAAASPNRSRRRAFGGLGFT